MVLTNGGMTDVKTPVDMMTDEEDTPGELNGGGSVATAVVVIDTTVVCTEVVPYAETVDVSVTGTVVVTVVTVADADAMQARWLRIPRPTWVPLGSSTPSKQK